MGLDEILVQLPEPRGMVRRRPAQEIPYTTARYWARRRSSRGRGRSDAHISVGASFVATVEYDIWR